MNMKVGRLYIDPETSEEIAKEVVKSLRQAIKKAVKEYMETEYEEFLDIKEAARMLGCSPSSLYKNKDTLLHGAYTYFGKSLRFPKYQLMRMMKEGKFKGDNV